MRNALTWWAQQLTLVVLAALGMGCATIMNGTTQDIGITSLPTGATVTVDAEPKGQTPLVTPLSRRSSHTVKVELEGYHPVEATITRHTNGWVWGNLAIGGLIGLSVDLLAGGMYNLSPGRIDTILQPLPAASDERPMHVATGQGPAPPQERTPLIAHEPPQVSVVEAPSAVPIPAAIPPRFVSPAAPPQPRYASRTLQPLPLVARSPAPQCADPAVRVLCPLYQYRLGIYRGTCKDGSIIEVGPDYVHATPPRREQRAYPWQAEACIVATVGETTRP